MSARLAVVTLLCVQGCAASGYTGYESVSVDDLYASPAKYVGKDICIGGIYLDDGGQAWFVSETDFVSKDRSRRGVVPTDHSSPEAMAYFRAMSDLSPAYRSEKVTMCGKIDPDSDCWPGDLGKKRCIPVDVTIWMDVDTVDGPGGLAHKMNRGRT